MREGACWYELRSRFDTILFKPTVTVQPLSLLKCMNYSADGEVSEFLKTNFPIGIDKVYIIIIIFICDTHLGKASKQ